jgi:hypothetical protein
MSENRLHLPSSKDGVNEIGDNISLGNMNKSIKSVASGRNTVKTHGRALSVIGENRLNLT